MIAPQTGNELCKNRLVYLSKKNRKQAGAVLVQAQLKLRLDFTLFLIKRIWSKKNLSQKKISLAQNILGPRKFGLKKLRVIKIKIKDKLWLSWAKLSSS